MSKAIYPGSFDPVTNGHFDIIQRASKIFDELVVGVLKNSEKNPTFTTEERIDMLREVCRDLKNVSVRSFDGLLVDFAKQENARVLVRGLRAVTDFEYELSIAQLNRTISSEVDTVFLTTNLKYSYLSSSFVKEIARYGGETEVFLDPYVKQKVMEKYSQDAIKQEEKK